jgi:hypothetical protein
MQLRTGCINQLVNGGICGSRIEQRLNVALRGGVPISIEPIGGVCVGTRAKKKRCSHKKCTNQSHRREGVSHMRSRLKTMQL